jgi:putative acyl-CoA dehydrogenase
MEDGPMPRLFRESPVNAIWEGSGNVQCLDVLRVLHKSPAAIDAVFAELALARGANAALDRAVAGLQREFADPAGLEYRARGLVDRMALTMQASLLARHAPACVADAFSASRLGGSGPHNCGALDRAADCAAIIGRATPRA